MKKIGAIKSFISFLAIFAALVFGPVWASACSNLGPEKHMGIVLRVDPMKGTMALMDAETRKTLNFKIDENLLKKIHVNDQIVITFKEKEDELIAKDVVVHASTRGVTRDG